MGPSATLLSRSHRGIKLVECKTDMLKKNFVKTVLANTTAVIKIIRKKPVNLIIFMTYEEYLMHREKAGIFSVKN